MNKLVAMSCCVMLASSPMALAQAPAAKKPTPVTKKEEADKKKGVQIRLGDCTKGAKGKNLQPDTREFDRHMADCING